LKSLIDVRFDTLMVIYFKQQKKDCFCLPFLHSASSRTRYGIVMHSLFFRVIANPNFSLAVAIFFALLFCNQFFNSTCVVSMVFPCRIANPFLSLVRDALRNISNSLGLLPSALTYRLLHLPSASLRSRFFIGCGNLLDRLVIPSFEGSLTINPNAQTLPRLASV
jgi:hypothetical protein